jgi:hypothetical protein
MYKGFKISVTLILMLACVSLGEIQQGQGFGIGGQNSVALIDGPGVADSTNLTTASQGQGASAMGGLLMAEEFQIGTLGQVAAVGGAGGGIGIDQNGSALLTQLQQQNGGTLGVQNQTAGIVLDDAMMKLGGNGVGIGLQAFLGAQYQVIASPFGISMNVNIPAASTLQVAHY